MDGVDDLGAVDALEVDAGDAKVRVPELALDDVERHAFAGHLDRMRVAELVRREPPTHAGGPGELPRRSARSGRASKVGRRRPVDDAK